MYKAFTAFLKTCHRIVGLCGEHIEYYFLTILVNLLEKIKLNVLKRKKFIIFFVPVVYWNKNLYGKVLLIRIGDSEIRTNEFFGVF